MENILAIPQLIILTAAPEAEATTVAVITRITFLLFLFLILAIFIERATEIFMSIIKYLDLKQGWYKFWNKQADKFRMRLDRLYGFQGSGNEDKKLLYRWILWNVVSEKPYIGGKDIIAAKSIRTHYYRIISKIFAFILSLAFSIWIYKYLEIDLVDILNEVGGVEMGTCLKPYARIILTTILLTAGSEPMHHLIKRFEKIGKDKKI